MNKNMYAYDYAGFSNHYAKWTKTELANNLGFHCYKRLLGVYALLI
jgi:hypothetical protein